MEEFSAPKIQIWHDMGILMYRHKTGGGQAAVPALAPLARDVRRPPRVGETELHCLKPLKSRSHWYYALSPQAKWPKQAPIDGELRLTVDTPQDPNSKPISRAAILQSLATTAQLVSAALEA